MCKAFFDLQAINFCRMISDVSEFVEQSSDFHFDFGKPSEMHTLRVNSTV